MLDTAILLLAFRGSQHIPIDARPSLPVLGFALVAIAATSIVFGIAPADGGQVLSAEALRGAGRATAIALQWWQKPLVVAARSHSRLCLFNGAGLVNAKPAKPRTPAFWVLTEGRLIVRSFRHLLATSLVSVTLISGWSSSWAMPGVPRAASQDTVLGRQHLERTRVMR